MALVILQFSQREYRVPFHLGRTAAGVAVPAVLIAILIARFGSIGGTALPVRILAAIGVSAGLFAVFGMTPADLRKGWGTALSIFTTHPDRQ
jgi:hypothetical protein